MDAIDVCAKMIHMFIIYFDMPDASIHFFYFSAVVATMIMLVAVCQLC